ncbi:phage major capsid protein [Paraburkholderia sacchari]|uniref:phage major capsid protein n=1 Tax=Paraburkholderia sacchari TaxID=159450 RepID=UPI00054412F3|nr:phage major capsid protein [Paraburkholderia sacchari]NLP64353.1 phage major capsid protein [Paraburkholderia sacchari]
MTEQHVLVRAARAVAVSGGDIFAAKSFAASKWGATSGVVSFLQRQIDAIGSLPVDPDWDMLRILGAYMVNLVKRKSAIMRINSVSPFLQVPVNAPILSMDVNAQANWVGEAASITTTDEGFSISRPGALKVAGMVIRTEELLRGTDPALDAGISRDLSRAIAVAADQAFCDPLNSGTAGVKPPSPFFGHTIDASGDLSADIATMLGNVDEDLLQEVVLLYNASDLPALLKAHYADESLLTIDGGTLFGFSATTAPIPPGSIAYVCPRLIPMVDLAVTVEASGQSIVQVTNSDTGETSVVSLFQQNLSALRGIWYVNWTRGIDSAAGMVTGLFGGGTT